MNNSRRTGSKTIVLAANSAWNLVNFRAPIIAALRECGFAIAAAVPSGASSEMLRKMDVDVYDVPLDARGFSPSRDARLLLRYYHVLRQIQPAAFLGFTVKPNIYGSLAAGRLRIPTINTITGLGTGFLSGRTLQAVISSLYRLALRQSERVFFHNCDDRDLFLDHKLISERQAAVIPGSGVDLQRFVPTADRRRHGPVTFLFIGRLLNDKGVLEFAQSASIVKKSRPARFQLLGPLERHPKTVQRDILDRFIRDGTIELLGSADDVRPFIAEADCVVLPSYREGLPRVILEAAAMATPVIATDVPGCRDAVDDGITGLLCEPKSAASLAEAMTAMLDMTPEARAEMGANGRKKIELEFSEERVSAAYLNALREIGV